MINYALQLYARLSDQFMKINEGIHCEQHKTERYFSIAWRYWELLRAELSGYEFKDLADEIYFFKHVKPLFTAEIEYCHLVYFSILFLPEGHDIDHVEFWQREALRKEKFQVAYQEFYTYFQSKSEAEDHIYYTRLGKNKELSIENRIYEHDGCTSSLYDPFVASFMAIERYCKLAEARLSSCLDHY